MVSAQTSPELRCTLVGGIHQGNPDRAAPIRTASIYLKPPRWRIRLYTQALRRIRRSRRNRGAGAGGAPVPGEACGASRLPARCCGMRRKLRRTACPAPRRRTRQMNQRRAYAGRKCGGGRRSPPAACPIPAALHVGDVEWGLTLKTKSFRNLRPSARVCGGRGCAVDLIAHHRPRGEVFPGPWDRKSPPQKCQAGVADAQVLAFMTTPGAGGRLAPVRPLRGLPRALAAPRPGALHLRS